MAWRWKNQKKWKALCLTAFICLWQASAAWGAAGQSLYRREPSMPVEDVLAETKTHMLSLDPSPGYSSQWFALGLARGGMDLGDPYFQTFYENMVIQMVNKGGVLHRAKYSEYSKAILSLTAVGIDARDVGGYNLLSYLADFTNVTTQGFNGPIWALAALNSYPEYTIPEDKDAQLQTTEQVLVDYLTDGEVEGGGWTLMGNRADVDITAMTIQALSPYYQREGYEPVTAAIDRGVDWLGSVQDSSTGGFSSMGAKNSESCAQVIVALCSIGIDPGGDARFIKEGNWPVADLVSYHVPGSGFMHVKPGEGNNGGAAAGTVDGMATEQGYYALAAYERFLGGKTSLYDMSDVAVQKGAPVEIPEPPFPTPPPGTPSAPETAPPKKDRGSGANPTVPAEGGNLPENPGTPTPSPAPSGTAGNSRPVGGSAAASQTPRNSVSEPETGRKKEKDKNNDNVQEGWNFEGESYQEQEEGNWDAVVAAQPEETAPSQEEEQDGDFLQAPGSAALGGAAGALVFEGALSLLRRRKGKRLGRRSA